MGPPGGATATRPAAPLICEFIDAHKDRFGVVPICRVLSAHGVKIAPRTYWAGKSRAPSRRAVRDAQLTEILAGICEPDARGRRKPESLYGSLKMWEHLNRQGIEVARCTVERLMRAHGWRGVTRARTVRTTIADPGHSRAPDLVKRNFKASAPGQLHVADFTYVPLDGGGFGCSALVIDAFAGLIAGWECALSKETAFVERAIRQAAALRERQGRPISGQAIHHSDAGSQYTSVRFAQTLLLAGLTGSVGSVGDAYDNALAETTIGLYKKRTGYRRSWCEKAVRAARDAVCTPHVPAPPDVGQPARTDGSGPAPADAAVRTDGADLLPADAAARTDRVPVPDGEAA